MQVVLLFCNEAHTEPSGKLTISGIFNELYAPDFPAKQERVVLAGVIEWDRVCGGMTPFTINLLSPDEKSIFTIDGHSQVDRRPSSRPPAKSVLILPMENVVFGTPGEYRVETTVDGQNISGPSLHLMRSDSNDL